MVIEADIMGDVEEEEEYEKHLLSKKILIYSRS